MLTQEQAQQFALQQQTTVDNILKEHYQMALLDILFNSPIGDSLVFKGGTALRLAYASVRFSEDLDFSLAVEAAYADFERAIGRVKKNIPGAAVKDIHEKYHTLYARLMFKVSYRAIPIGVKVEINKNTRDFDKTVALIRSPFNNLEVIGSVYTLESILKDKLRIIENRERREPRDLFDAWYISQRLGRPLAVKDAYKFSRKELMDSLFHFLPKNQRRVIELFEI
jgi:predicted nucleotidyltransferase component of viral defense system